MCFVRIHKVEEAAHPVLRVLKRTVPNFHRDIAIVNAGLHYGVGDPGYRYVSHSGYLIKNCTCPQLADCALTQAGPLYATACHQHACPLNQQNVYC